MRTKRTAYLALTFAVICWGLAPVTTRELVASLAPLHLLLLRFCIATLIFAPVLIQFRAWSPKDRLKMIGYALIAVLGYYVPVTIGGRYIPSGTTGLLVTTQTLWMAGLAVIFSHESMTPVTWLGIGISTAGIVLLLGGGAVGQSLSGGFLLGAVLTLVGALMWAIYSLVLRPLVAKYGALVVLAVFSTVIGNLLWSYAIVRVSGVQSGLFLYLIPLVSVLGGTLYLHEVIVPQTIVSGLLIIGGVALAQMVKMPVSAPAVKHK
jgi:drug/metabolite transporter (DMT)-like permease